MQTSYQIGKRAFLLDKNKAEAAFAAKRVINGRQTMTFNLLPLKYQWAYDLYQSMKAEQWGPMRAEIQIDHDAKRWLSDDPAHDERRIIKIAVGWLSAATRMPANQIQHLVRELVTAPELKLVLGRHVQEENIRAEMLLYVMFSLGINPHECEARFEQSPAIMAMNRFVAGQADGLDRNLDLTTQRNQQLLARNIFLIGQCARGIQLHGLFGAVLSLHHQGRYPGLGTMLSYTLRNEANYIEFFGNLFMELVGENPVLKTPKFQAELANIMSEATTLEKAFIAEALPRDLAGVNADDLARYVDYIADRRLRCCGLPPLNPGLQNPMPWLDPMIHLRNEPMTQLKSTSLQHNCNDDEL